MQRINTDRYGHFQKISLIKISILFTFFVLGCRPSSNFSSIAISITTKQSLLSSKFDEKTIELQSNKPPNSNLSWRSFTNANDISIIIDDSKGNIWTAGRGGIVKWNLILGKYEKYTVEHGVAGNYIRDLEAGPDGTLWAVTYDGILSFFDGENWSTHNTPQGYVITNIITTPKGVLWAGTNNGVLRYDGVSWTSFTDKDGLAGNYIQTMEVSGDGTVWVGATGGISYFDGQQWITQAFPVGRTVISLKITGSGSVWFGTMDGLLGVFESGTWRTYRIYNELGNVFPILSLAISESDGLIWFSDSKRIFSFDGKICETVLKLEESFVSSLFVDSENTLWIGRYYGGLSYFNGSTLTTYKTEDKLLSNFVTSVATSDDGAIWFGTNEGASMYRRGEWSNFTIRDGLVHNSILALAISADGAVWFGTENGISSFDGQNWISYTTQNGLPDNRVTSILLSGGTVWAGTPSGVARLNGSNWDTYSTGNKTNLIMCFAVTDNQTIWFGTKNKLDYFDGSIWTNVYLPSINISSCTYDNRSQKLWLGTENSGIQVLEDGVWNALPSNNGLEPGPIRYIKSDGKGSIWATAGGSVIRIRGENWAIYSTPEGILDIDISSLGISPDGSIWLGFYHHGGLIFTPPENYSGFW